MQNVVERVRVPRRMVHKSADREVLLSSATRIGEDRFAVGVCWPDHHLLHHHRADGTRDSLVVAETMRQAGIYLSHRFHDVPADYAFVLHRFDFQLTEPIRDRDAGSDVVLDIQVLREPGNPNRFRMASVATLEIAGRPVGRASMRWDAFAPRQYAIIRRRGMRPDTDQPVAPSSAAPHVALPAALVGRDRDDAVLLADGPATPQGWRLLMNTGHPALFDHASDHVPGMVLVEAFRQAVLLRMAPQAADGWSIRQMDLSFHRFGDLDVPVTITAESAGEGVFQLAARQGMEPLASARVAGCADVAAPVAALAGAASC